MQLVNIADRWLIDSQILFVANLIGQRSIRHDPPLPIPPIRYDALIQGFHTLHREAQLLNATLHMPRLGAGNAGGDWTIIERLIDLYLPGIECHIYDLPQQPHKNNRR